MACLRMFLNIFFRDPNVSKTLDSFNASLNWLVHTNHSEQDINEAKLSVFSDVSTLNL